MEIQRQADQYPDAVEFNKVADTRDEYPYKDLGHTPTDNLGDDDYLYNRDSELGTTVPHSVGGDDPHAVTDARVMHPEETGLEYDVLAHPAKGHGDKAFDVIKPL